MTIAAGTLPALETLDADTLALILGPSRAQPRGVAGRVDWRLGGRLARLVRDRRFAGRPGERLLTLGGGGLGPARVLLIGEAPDPEDRRAAVRALVDAGARRVALATSPGQEVVQDSLRWLEAVGAEGGALEAVALLDEGGALEAAREAVAAAARRVGRALEEAAR